jgi:RNA polymerase sigma-54 factor
MALAPKLELKQSQSMVMTPQLTQAIKLLQLSGQDLLAYVENELEKNPLLERVSPENGFAESASDNEIFSEYLLNGTSVSQDLNLSSEFNSQSAHALNETFDGHLDNVFPDHLPESGQEARDKKAHTGSASSSVSFSSSSSSSSEAPDWDNMLANTLSMQDHVLSQYHLATSNIQKKQIGAYLVNCLDERGYLQCDVDQVAETLGCTPGLISQCIALLQSLEPAGIGARSLQECLKLQLQAQNRFDPAMSALLDNLHLVAKRDFRQLMRLCGVDRDDLAEMLEELRRLDPKPGRHFEQAMIENIVPDVMVSTLPDGSFALELNNETLPRVLVNQSYYAQISGKTSKSEDKDFLDGCFQDASWLVRSLDQRARTILKVAKEIVKQQDGFLTYGINYLKPLTLRMVADAIEMHESTVSRVTSNKYMATPRGIFEMKFFFCAAIPASGEGEAHSAQSVRHRIKTLIDQEKPEAILSDDAIVKMLKEDGIAIARRTVTKYREAMRIPSSVQRRRDKSSDF